jgi:hypothetical protein
VTRAPSSALPRAECPQPFATYSSAEIVWAQEEPKNQGARSLLHGELGPPGRQAGVGGGSARFGLTRHRIAPAPPEGAQRISPAGVGVVKVLLLGAAEVVERVAHAEFVGGGVASA